MAVTVSKLKDCDTLVDRATVALGKLPVQPPLEILWGGKLTGRLQALFVWGDVSMSDEDLVCALGKAFDEKKFGQLLPVVSRLTPHPVGADASSTLALTDLTQQLKLADTPRVDGHMRVFDLTCSGYGKELILEGGGVHCCDSPYHVAPIHRCYHRGPVETCESECPCPRNCPSSRLPRCSGGGGCTVAMCSKCIRSYRRAACDAEEDADRQDPSGSGSSRK